MNPLMTRLSEQMFDVTLGRILHAFDNIIGPEDVPKGTKSMWIEISVGVLMVLTVYNGPLEG